MLARNYFLSSTADALGSANTSAEMIGEGSFNIAIQDGKEAGQTVPHVHCHIIPRVKGGEVVGDAVYDRLQSEDGNVGGGLWDVQRPVQEGRFPRSKFCGFLSFFVFFLGGVGLDFGIRGLRERT
jgi:bis(5'-adenosyl)-triphosphatase